MKKFLRRPYKKLSSIVHDLVLLRRIKRSIPKGRWRSSLDRISANVIPAELGPDDQLDHLPKDELGSAGLDLRTNQQLDLLRRWKGHVDLFRSLRDDPQINVGSAGDAFIWNPWFRTPDAEVYAAMIADLRPSLVLEVGGGFSTLVARRTIDYLGADCQIVVIDPQPRTNVVAAASSVINEYVERVPVAELPMKEDMVFFVDSSHVARARGDVPYLYNVVIPRLPSGAAIHVHDIFIPYEYPPHFQARLYTEQYVVHSLLSHSRRHSVIFANHYMAQRFPGEMQEVFSKVVATHVNHYGTSFWIRVDGRGD